MRRNVEQTVRKVLLFILSVTIFAQIPLSVFAMAPIETGQKFKRKNYQLQYELCDQSAANTVRGNANSSPGANAKEGCGEQGYDRNNPKVSEANKQQVWRYITTMDLNGKKLTNDQAAGLMGNFDKETGGTFLPDAKNWIDCIGIAQWCYGRADDGSEDSLKGFAAKNGSDWTCLQTQLDFLHYEMTKGKEKAVVDPLLGTSSAKDAANTFHDYYERSNKATGEHLGRDTRAEKILSEFSGQPGGGSTSPPSGGGGSTTTPCSAAASQAATSGNASNAAMISAECDAVKARVLKLIEEKKIKPEEGNPWYTENVKRDTNNCVTSEVTCGVGAHVKILRVLADTTDRSGASEVVTRNINSGHGCDEFQHPKGEAMDFYCPRNSQTGKVTEDCNKIFKHLYDNFEELELNQLIWNEQDLPDGYSCGGKITCMNDHNNEIHAAIKGSNKNV